MEKKRKKQNLLLKYLSDIFSAVLMTTWLLLDTFCLTFMEFFFFFLCGTAWGKLFYN